MNVSQSVQPLDDVTTTWNGFDGVCMLSLACWTKSCRFKTYSHSSQTVSLFMKICIIIFVFCTFDDRLFVVKRWTLRSDHVTTCLHLSWSLALTILRVWHVVYNLGDFFIVVQIVFVVSVAILSTPYFDRFWADHNYVVRTILFCFTIGYWRSII